MHKVLFVTSEAHPLIKTGGLGDVAGSLPAALRALNCDIRLVLPAYRSVLKHAGRPKTVAEVVLPGLAAPVHLLEGHLPGTKVPVWLVDYPPAYDRSGNPYLDPLGLPWEDNAERFAVLARTAEHIALGRAGLSWRPDVVHANDWQTGLTVALLNQTQERPATVFTIHNLAYQGLFAQSTFVRLGLPPTLWSPEALEFYGQLSFIKGGLVFADMLSTVSPTYAREIQTPDFGFGLDGLLRHRSDRLVGILNGIDDGEWDPVHDPRIERNYDAGRLQDKLVNKRSLQQEHHLVQDPRIPLIGMVGRLVQQKGIDLVLHVLPRLMHEPVQFVILGSGEVAYESALRAVAARFPGRIAVRIGYDETAAHRIESGADMFLMPSRFEPCGLNQLYSLRYGTVPIVRRVGGLADTVIDATAASLRAESATGIAFDSDHPDALTAAVLRALALYADIPLWQKLVVQGMRQDFSWRLSAQNYLKLYDAARRVHRKTAGA